MKTEKYVKTSVSLAPHLMDKVDAYAAELGINRSAAMATLVKQAFDYQESMKQVADFNANFKEYEKVLLEGLKNLNGEIK